VNRLKDEVIGEVQCLNCGRTLAAAVRNPDTGRLRLTPAAWRDRIEVDLVDRHALRCRHCHGRAFLERLLDLDMPPAAALVASGGPVVGAA
jgi:hypothetical protein